VAAALAFLFYNDWTRAKHVEFASHIADEPPIGGGRGSPRIIVPEHSNASYEWLDLTRQMLATGQVRVRRIDYENAPFGRTVYAASPYRWWLGLVAWCDAQVSGRSAIESLEDAAVLADPLLHALLVIATALLVAARFGTLAAVFSAMALVTLFPLAAEFLPGAPDDHGLSLACGLGSVLWLLVPVWGRRESPALGASAVGHTAKSERADGWGWFAGAGVIGGIGLWINVSCQVPFLVGIGVGALIGAGIISFEMRRNPAAGVPVLPWRIWGLAGSLTVLTAYLVEYFPGSLGDWQLRAIHPLFGLAWLGGAEGLALATACIHRTKNCRSRVAMGRAFAGLMAMAALPVAMWKQHSFAFLESDLETLRLVRLPGGAAAPNLFAWFSASGGNVVVTVLPLAIVILAAWLLLRSASDIKARVALAIALGPVLVGLVFVTRQLWWWNGIEAALVVLGIVVIACLSTWAHSPGRLWLVIAASSLLLLPGAVALVPRSTPGSKEVLDEFEVFGLIERDLGRWLALHAGAPSAVVLAPHNLSATFHYYSGLRGLATFGWENRDGLSGAVRLLSASTPEEARELVDRRAIKYIVMPSWDPYLNIYAQMGMGQLEGTFLNNLNNWKLPLWLRPVAYQLPEISGFEGQSVRILEVVEDQAEAVSLSRIAEYFIDSGNLNEAAAVAQALRRFPADVGASVARAEVEIARSDSAAFAQMVDQLKSRITSGADRSLPWDRRVALAVVFARAKQTEFARNQVKRCFAEVDDGRLRSLPTPSLYRLLVLGRAFGIAIEPADLRTLAISLLPAEMQHRLAGG
jgi:hypothetical protein